MHKYLTKLATLDFFVQYDFVVQYLFSATVALIEEVQRDKNDFLFYSGIVE